MPTPNMKDFATVLVTSAPSPALTGVTMSVESGIVGRLPAVPFVATATPEGQIPTLDNAEQINVTDITGSILTFQRHQGATAAKKIAVGWRIYAGPIAAHVAGAYNRANHTGTQLAATISDFAAAVLAIEAGTGGGVYTNATPVPVTLGGVEAGETFAAVPLTDVITDLLYPYQLPAFSSFSMSGQASPVEVGTTISGTKTFTWGTTNSANVAVNSINIADQSGDLATGLANDGSESVAITSRQLTAPGSYNWTISGTDTNANNFSRNFTVNWYWKIYFGTSANTTLTESQIEALTGQLAASGLATYSYAANDYKYLCYPASLPAASLFTDTLTGFDVTMADATDNAAYSNTANGYSYALVSVTNAQGQTTNYRVYRTKFTLSGSINIRVT